jgi:putative endonuclease
MKSYFVYIMTNKSRTLYTGVTNNLERRVYEHKHNLVPGFTSKYNITKLVHYEETNDVNVALAREKQIKGWLRSKKIALIEAENPEWKDLSLEWYSELCHPERGEGSLPGSARLFAPLRVTRQETRSFGCGKVTQIKGMYESPKYPPPLRLQLLGQRTDSFRGHESD